MKTLVAITTMTAILYVLNLSVVENNMIKEQREDCIIEVEMQYSDEPELMNELIIDCHDEFKVK